MNLDWKEKAKHNVASIKFWVWCVATGLLIGKVINQTTWLAITGTLMGVARVFEYFTMKGNGNGAGVKQ